MNDLCAQAQGFHDGVVDGGTHVSDFHVFARGIDTIGQQNDKELAIRIDPNGCAGEPGVAIAMDGEIVATGTAFGGHDPTKGTGVLREWLGHGEFGDGGALQDAIVRIDSTVEKHLAKG